LNPRAAHDNPASAACCSRCDYLVEGARIGIYEVVSFLGAGSYGHVYQVREPAPLGRVLALKVLRYDQFNDKALGNFFDEARRIANLQHPNILPVYNFGKLEDDRPYLVMDYAPRTIYDLFRHDDGRRRPAFAEELIPYLQQAADALSYVHGRGLIHQDVKPSNLLIGRNGQVLLSDFGTTFYLGMQTHASLGEVTGTAAYMPPEQWQGNPRRDSDQYALAVSFYDLLAGRLPFQYRRIEEMWNAHLREQPPSPLQWNRRIPVEVAAVILQAMAKDYHQRYATIADFAQQYIDAVGVAQQRYLCGVCGRQNRTGAQRCSECGAEQDGRRCFYCDAPGRFGQRCCSTCGRLITPPGAALHSPLTGVAVRQGRYQIVHVLKSTPETGITVSIATDAQANEARVLLKRWECTDFPLDRRAKDVVYYDRVTEPLARFRHPMIPPVLERFAEGQHYYLALAYIDGETLQARMQRLLRPLAERDVLGYMNILLNTLIAMQRQQPHISHYDLSPANIIIERARGRAMLTGFQMSPPPALHGPSGSRHHTTRKLALSPYLPIQDKVYDQRTCIYSLAACMHYALTNHAPPHYPAFPPVRLLNPAVSPAFELIISRALMEETRDRYQSLTELQADIRRLL